MRSRRCLSRKRHLFGISDFTAIRYRTRDRRRHDARVLGPAGLAADPARGRTQRDTALCPRQPVRLRQPTRLTPDRHQR